MTLRENEPVNHLQGVRDAALDPPPVHFPGVDEEPGRRRNATVAAVAITGLLAVLMTVAWLTLGPGSRMNGVPPERLTLERAGGTAQTAGGEPSAPVATKAVAANGTTCMVPVQTETTLLPSLGIYYDNETAGMETAIAKAAAEKALSNTQYGSGPFALSLVRATDTGRGLPGPGMCPQAGRSTIYQRLVWLAITPLRPTDPQSIFADLPPGTVLAPERDVIMIDASTGEVLLMATVS